jgi:hypothetical protein
LAVRWSEVGWALLTFVALVALPLMAVQYVPEQTLTQLSTLGLDVPALAMSSALLGLVISAIALAKAIVARTSLAYLILDVSSNIVSLVFALLVVGVGNVGSLGYSSFSLKQGKVTTEIALDLRIFIYLTVALVAVSVLQSIARFREERTEESRMGTN